MTISPLPTQVIKTTANTSRFGMFSILKFTWKHLYIISLIFFLLPTIIHSIQTAKETSNPSYPFIETGLTVINADNQLDKEVRMLEENPVQLIGEKPDAGIWKHIKYYWNLILLYWKIIGLLFLITAPFKFIYWILKKKGDQAGYETTFWDNLKKTLVIGLILVFIVNLIIVIVGLSDGTLLLDLPDSTIYQKAWFVIVQTFPFHGTWHFGQYLIALFSA